MEAFSLNTGGGSVGAEIERVCLENELVITTWSPIHLRTKLKEIYWKEGQPAAGAMAFWEDTLRYLYLPRLRNRDVLAQAIRSGAASRDFFGTAYGQRDSRFEGFQLGSSAIQFDDTLLLIEPEAAREYEASQAKPVEVPPSEGGVSADKTGPTVSPPEPGGGSTAKAPTVPIPEARMRSFHGTADVPATTAKMRLVQVAEEIISVLLQDPSASIKVVVEISAEFPGGAPDSVKRAVSQNAEILGLKAADWE
jgi:hypothetical protein